MAMGGCQLLVIYYLLLVICDRTRKYNFLTIFAQILLKKNQR